MQELGPQQCIHFLKNEWRRLGSSQQRRQGLIRIVGRSLRRRPSVWSRTRDVVNLFAEISRVSLSSKAISNAGGLGKTWWSGCSTNDRNEIVAGASLLTVHRGLLEDVAVRLEDCPLEDFCGRDVAKVVLACGLLAKNDSFLADTVLERLLLSTPSSPDDAQWTGDHSVCDCPPSTALVGGDVFSALTLNPHDLCDILVGLARLRPVTCDVGRLDAVVDQICSRFLIGATGDRGDGSSSDALGGGPAKECSGDPADAWRNHLIPGFLWAASKFAGIESLWGFCRGVLLPKLAWEDLKPALLAEAYLGAVLLVGRGTSTGEDGHAARLPTVADITALALEKGWPQSFGGQGRANLLVALSFRVTAEGETTPGDVNYRAVLPADIGEASGARSSEANCRTAIFDSTFPADFDGRVANGMSSISSLPTSTDPLSIFVLQTISFLRNCPRDCEPPARRLSCLCALAELSVRTGHSCDALLLEAADRLQSTPSIMAPQESAGTKIRHALALTQALFKSTADVRHARSRARQLLELCLANVKELESASDFSRLFTSCCVQDMDYSHPQIPRAFDVLVAKFVLVRQSQTWSSTSRVPDAPAFRAALRSSVHAAARLGVRTPAVRAMVQRLWGEDVGFAAALLDMGTRDEWRTFLEAAQWTSGRSAVEEDLIGAEKNPSGSRVAENRPRVLREAILTMLYAWRVAGCEPTLNQLRDLHELCRENSRLPAEAESSAEGAATLQMQVLASVRSWYDCAAFSAEKISVFSEYGGKELPIDIAVFHQHRH